MIAALKRGIEDGEGRVHSGWLRGLRRTVMKEEGCFSFMENGKLEISREAQGSWVSPSECRGLQRRNETRGPRSAC